MKTVPMSDAVPAIVVTMRGCMMGESVIFELAGSLAARSER
jgi:hypothetical protein